MLDCAEFLEGYSDYRDGLLPPDAAAEYAAHAASCASCARYDRVVSAGVKLLHQLPRIEPSDDFIPRLQHRLYHLDDERRPWDRRASAARVGATVAVAAAIAVMAWVPAMNRSAAPVLLPAVAANAPRTPAPAIAFPPRDLSRRGYDWVDLMRSHPPGFSSLTLYELDGPLAAGAQLTIQR